MLKTLLKLFHTFQSYVIVNGTTAMIWKSKGKFLSKFIECMYVFLKMYARRYILYNENNILHKTLRGSSISNVILK